MNETHEIIASLQPLFKEARECNLWFYTGYQDIWFSPDELEKEQANGRFVWGHPNWKLRSPYERFNEFHVQTRNVNQAYEEFNQRIKNSGL